MKTIATWDRWSIKVAELYESEVQNGFRETKGLTQLVHFYVEDTVLEESIGQFAFAPLAGNCGIVVSTDTWVTFKRRGKGLSHVLHDIKEYLARRLGYTLMMATVVDNNEPQIKGMLKYGWSIRQGDLEFVNKRTNNRCLICFKTL